MVPSTPAQTQPVQIPGFAPSDAAFLLDFDGSLVEIAPTPNSVVVPDALLTTLRRLRDKCGGALAIVTGRPIEQIDHFLPGIPYAVAGEHGVALRRTPGGAIERATLPCLPEHWLQEAETLADAWPGTAVERKRAGFVLHYRGNPQAAAPFEALATRLVAGSDNFHVQPAKMAFEIRAVGIDKGHAVAALLEQAPFAGRKPIFVGDDATDLDGVREARAHGGLGLMIPDDFADVPAYRHWLDTLARGEADQWGA